MVPFSPTAKMSLAELPQTALSHWLVSEPMAVQSVPSEWSTAPFSPTAKISLAWEPQMERRAMSSLLESDWVRFRINPWLPTASTSVIPRHPPESRWSWC